jgi:predicted DNA-binding transcriptional regulator AlpA
VQPDGYGPTPARSSSVLSRPVRLLSPEKVAAYLGLPVKTLYQWRYKGVGPQAFRVGRHLRYRPVDLEAWLLRQRDRLRQYDASTLLPAGVSPALVAERLGHEIQTLMRT